MARRPQPRHITLGGREAVALTVEEYEQLIASRRQIGGQSARVRVLAHQARRTEQLLHELETLISPVACTEQTGQAPTTDPPTCPAVGTAPSDMTADCLRCAIADLLHRHRDAAP
ncbi:hypothetical protein [Streptomyces sp. ATCC 21386]|uniref:hypothetical protein n=1 Tax=Streptomyces sp. ATCC 21386 TaxID=2699428 RepID=UPI001BFF0C70|nr:hypothetical protein [Streptomyces sp. ATCC 21386]